MRISERLKRPSSYSGDSKKRLKHSQFMLKCSMAAFIISSVILWSVIIWRLF